MIIDGHKTMHRKQKQEVHDLITPEEAAPMLRLGPRRVRQLLCQGLLPGFKIGKLWRMRRSDIDNLGRPQPTEKAA
jgi:excisionase family DNA binding protein